MSNPVSAADFNLLDPAFRANPYPYYAALRRESPVHRVVPNAPLFAISRYEDIHQILQRPTDFSSTAFQTLFQGGLGLTPNSGALAGNRLIASPMMISVDPPHHARMRGLVNRGFTPRRIAALEPRLRALATSCIEDVLESGGMDLVRDLSIPFPVTVIAELLGIEPDRRRDFKRWSDATVVGLSGIAGDFTRDEVKQNADEMADYIERIAADRRAKPKDDLISVLVQAEGGDALSTGEVLSFVFLLLVAGNETTTNLIGNAMKALLEHPDQLAEVVANPRLIPAMIEETLRYDSPVQMLPRKANRDIELAGGRVEEGSLLLSFFASANRDEKHFSEPDRFDIQRPAQAHLAFGYGIHFCLGASLARLEARVAFEVLFSRCRNLRLAGDGVAMLDSLALRGPKSLALDFEAA